jgi:Fe-S cluster assembly scaffold protein SufB
LSVQPLRLAFATEPAATSISRALEEPDWLLDERLDAARLVAELPAETNRLFTPYIDIRAARFAEIAPYDRVHRVPADAAGLPQGAAALVSVEADRVAVVVADQAREAGLVVETFAEALVTRPTLLRTLIEAGRTLPANDAFAQVARTASTIGILVHVPAGLELEQPIVLRWGSAAAGRGVVGRTVISLGDGARASVLEEQLPGGADSGAQDLWWGTMEVTLGAGAALDVAGQQDFGQQTVAFVTRQAQLERDSTLRWALASVGAALYRSRIDNRLVGRGASVKQVEIGFGGGSQLFDLTSYTRHIGEDTTGDLLSKGVFLDRARGYFKGLIAIEQTARGTDSFLGEFAMLLAKRARSVAIPSLEIDQPDVRRASHSSSVGPIDDAQVFYLMTRGLSREQARKAIVLGFLEPVVARIPLPDARERLRALLEAKWPAATTVTDAAA